MVRRGSLAAPLCPPAPWGPPGHAGPLVPCSAPPWGLCAELKRYAARPPHPGGITPPGRAVPDANWRVLSRPAVGRVVAGGGGVAWWGCGLRRSGPAPRQFAGRPKNGVPAAPANARGSAGPSCGALRAALRGWAALGPLRASRSPFFPPRFAGPPAGPAARWGAVPVPVPAPWFSGFCVPAAASPRFSPARGQGTQSARALGCSAPAGAGCCAACGPRRGLMLFQTRLSCTGRSYSSPALPPFRRERACSAPAHPRQWCQCSAGP